MTADCNLPELRRSLVEVLAEPTTTHELVVAAAETIAVEARVNYWFLHHLKTSGTEEEIFAVLEVLEICTTQCVEAWNAYKMNQATMSDVLTVVVTAKDRLQSFLTLGADEE